MTLINDINTTVIIYHAVRGSDAVRYLRVVSARLVMMEERNAKI